MTDLEQAACDEVDALSIWLRGELPGDLRQGMEISLDKMARALQQEKVDLARHCRFYKN